MAEFVAKRISVPCSECYLTYFAFFGPWYFFRGNKINISYLYTVGQYCCVAEAEAAFSRAAHAHLSKTVVFTAIFRENLDATRETFQNIRSTTELAEYISRWKATF